MEKFQWKLKDVLMIAISAVLFGVVYLGCTYAGGFYMAFQLQLEWALLAMSLFMEFTSWQQPLVFM